MSLSQATVDLFVCLRLSHTLETSHFHEVGMKRLEGRLAGGLRGRQGTPGVSLSAGRKMSVFLKGGTAKERALGGVVMGVYEAAKSLGGGWT